MLELPSTLSQFLAFLGTPVFAAFVVSEVLEQMAWFQKFDSQRKSLTVLAFSLVLGLLSFALVRWVPPSVVENLQPVYAVVIGTITAFLSGQIYHDKAHTETPVG